MEKINFTCQECNEYIKDLEEVPRHECFFGKNVFARDNILFAENITKGAPSQHGEEEENIDGYLMECAVERNACVDLTGGADITNKMNDENTNSIKNIKKDSFIWTNKATLALLSTYELKVKEADMSRHSNKLYNSIAEELLTLGYKVNGDKVRWKMNMLLRKYKTVKDNNSKSGRGNESFMWMEQMESIFGKQRSINCTHTISSSSIPSVSKRSKSEDLKLLEVIPGRKRNILDENHNAHDLYKSKDLAKHRQQNKLLKITQDNILISTTNVIDKGINLNEKTDKRRARLQHGTGSNTAKTKILLEQQWIEHLKIMNNRYEKQDENQKLRIKRDTEEFRLRQHLVVLKEKELEWKERFLRKQLEAKQERHKERMKIEQEKCTLLEKLIQKPKTSLSLQKSPSLNDSDY